MHDLLELEREETSGLERSFLFNPLTSGRCKDQMHIICQNQHWATLSDIPRGCTCMLSRTMANKAVHDAQGLDSFL